MTDVREMLDRVAAHLSALVTQRDRAVDLARRTRDEWAARVADARRSRNLLLHENTMLTTELGHVYEELAETARQWLVERTRAEDAAGVIQTMQHNAHTRAGAAERESARLAMVVDEKVRVANVQVAKIARLTADREDAERGRDFFHACWSQTQSQLALAMVWGAELCSGFWGRAAAQYLRERDGAREDYAALVLLHKAVIRDRNRAIDDRSATDARVRTAYETIDAAWNAYPNGEALRGAGVPLAELVRMLHEQYATMRARLDSHDQHFVVAAVDTTDTSAG